MISLEVRKTKSILYSWLYIGTILLLIFSSACSSTLAEQTTEINSNIVNTETHNSIQKTQDRNNNSTIKEPHQTPSIASQIPNKISGEVVNVLDGVTIEIDIGQELYRISYQYLELPLPYTGNSEIEDLRVASLKLNEYLVLGKSVDVELTMAKISETNNYEGFVYSKGELVNKIMLESGLARLSGKASSSHEIHGFVKAQNEAMKAMRGIWAEPNPDSTHPVSVTQNTTSSPQILTPFKGGTLPQRPKSK